MGKIGTLNINTNQNYYNIMPGIHFLNKILNGKEICS